MHILFAVIILMGVVGTVQGSESCDLNPRSKKVIHYHLHKTGGITLNKILLDRYHGKQLHGAKRKRLDKSMREHQGSFMVMYVREPVAALLSRFYFWRAFNVGDGLETSKSRKVLCQTLDEYMTKEASHNFMFDSIAVGQPMGRRCQPKNSTGPASNFTKPQNLKTGATWLDVCPGGSSEEDFVAALVDVLWALRAKVFVGVTERYDESLLLFAEQAGRALGLTNMAYCADNLVVGGLKKADLKLLSPSSVALMESRNRLDTVLVKAANLVLDARAACADNAPTNQREDGTNSSSSSPPPEAIRFSQRLTSFTSTLRAYQVQRHCTMEQLKTPPAGWNAKLATHNTQTHSARFLAPKLANPDFVLRNLLLCNKHRRTKEKGGGAAHL